MYFNLLPTTIVTQGARDALIFNLKKSEYFKIPGFLTGLLQQLKAKPVEEIILTYNSPDISRKINEFIKWLNSNNFGFFSEHRVPFTELNTHFDTSAITNSILEIDFDKGLNQDINNILEQLVNLGCQAIELRCLNNTGTTGLLRLLEIVENYDFKAIEVLIEQCHDLSKDEINKLCIKYVSITRLVIFNATISESFVLEKSNCIIYFSEKKTNLSKSCGLISELFFGTTQKQYIESKTHNSCLNRKITIAANGNIKNCPSMIESFGNIVNTKLAEALDKEEFKKYWHITKDHISVCRDCEFRQVCTDCRAYTEDPADKYSKPLKCGYDPYTGIWQEWSANALKQKAIDYYSLDKNSFQIPA